MNAEIPWEMFNTNAYKFWNEKIDHKLVVIVDVGGVSDIFGMCIPVKIHATEEYKRTLYVASALE